jgi:hypothetical protein
MCAYLPIGTEKLNKIKIETELDEVLVKLKTIILQGWPDERKKVPTVLIPYYNFADEMTVQDGLIFKGDRVVIPKGLR